MRAFTSFNLWIKWVQQQRPLPPIFDKLDFTKKNSLSFYLHICQTCRSEIPPSHRAHQKNDQRLSWSSSDESLKYGVNFTGSVYRMRIDVVVNAVCLAVASTVSALLDDADVDVHNIDWNAYVCRNTCLPGLGDCVWSSGGFREEIETPL